MTSTPDPKFDDHKFDDPKFDDHKFDDHKFDDHKFEVETAHIIDDEESDTRALVRPKGAVNCFLYPPCSSFQYVKWGQQAISAVLHICIMVWFEIYLFFWYIIPVEQQLIKEQVSAYLKTVDVMYDQFVPENAQLILSSVVRDDPQILMELQKLHKSYLDGKQDKENTVHDLQIVAFHMFSVVVGVFVGLLFVHIPMLRKMDWMVILSENAGMLVGLGCFQFLFFTHVVLEYSPLSDTDMQYWCATHVYQTIVG